MTDTDSPSTSPLRRLLELPVSAFLFGAYAVFFLWSRNVDKVRTADVLMPLVVVLGGTAVLFAIGWLAYRNAWRSALAVSVLSFLFFSYGHIIGSSTIETQEAATGPANEQLWLALWAALAIGAIVGAAFLRRDAARRVAFVVNVVLGVLLVMSVVTIGMEKVRERRAPAAVATATPPGLTSSVAPSSVKPASAASKTDGKRDVYFIILDRYANQQTLAENYDHDNSYFIDGLRDRGFFVASKSRGPYPKTPHSIQTTLNMEFVDLPKESKDWQLVYDKLKNPKSAQFLKKQGYKYVLMGSGYHSLRSDPAADINIVYDPKSGPAVTEFSQVLYDSTVLSALAKRLRFDALDPRWQAFERAKFQYEQIPAIAKLPERTFMFAHILITHPPYVVDGKCNFKPESDLDKQTIDEAYVDTVECEGRKTLELIDRLQDVPADEQPIIVIQGDEGPGPVGWNPNTKAHYDWTTSPQKVMLEKFRIFNSYYLPGLDETGLYENISPVNSFRLIFNRYFGADLPLLPDRSYVFRDELHPYEFIDVTERVKN
jgi:hypothetical protein